MTPPQILVMLSRVLGHVQNGEKLELLDAHILGGGGTRRHFAFLFQFSAVNKCFSWALLCHLFVHFYCVFFLAILQNGPHVWCYRAVWGPERRRL